MQNAATFKISVNIEAVCARTLAQSAVFHTHTQLAQPVPMQPARQTDVYSAPVEVTGVCFPPATSCNDSLTKNLTYG